MSSAPPPVEFARRLLRVAIAQVCQQADGKLSERDDDATRWARVQVAALDTFCAVTERYVLELSQLSASLAALARRTEVTPLDVAGALSELGSSMGALIAARHYKLMLTPPIGALMEFVEGSEPVPFSWGRAPQFPARRPNTRAVQNNVLEAANKRQRDEEGPLVAQQEESTWVRPRHVPAFLPSFPDAHTYQRTPVVNERGETPEEERERGIRENEKVEKAYIAMEREEQRHKRKVQADERKGKRRKNKAFGEFDEEGDAIEAERRRRLREEEGRRAVKVEGQEEEEEEEEGEGRK